MGADWYEPKAMYGYYLNTGFEGGCDVYKEVLTKFQVTKKSLKNEGSDFIEKLNDHFRQHKTNGLLKDFKKIKTGSCYYATHSRMEDESLNNNELVRFYVAYEVDGFALEDFQKLPPMPSKETVRQIMDDFYYGVSRYWQIYRQLKLGQISKKSKFSKLPVDCLKLISKYALEKLSKDYDRDEEEITGYRYNSDNDDDDDDNNENEEGEVNLFKPKKQKVEEVVIRSAKKNKVPINQRTFKQMKQEFVDHFEIEKPSVFSVVK